MRNDESAKWLFKFMYFRPFTHLLKLKNLFDANYLNQNDIEKVCDKIKITARSTGVEWFNWKINIKWIEGKNINSYEQTERLNNNFTGKLWTFIEPFHRIIKASYNYL